MGIEAKREDYIDVNDALNRIGGNMDLYKRLLGRFLDGNHYDTLRDAVQGGDTEEAVRLAHTLKGVSANLSLVMIKTITADLEHSLKEGTDPAEQLAGLEQACKTTVEMITELIG